jgi:hypothetical protein
MASQTAICNRALEFLGEAPIVSIDEDRSQAKALRRVYDETRRALLEDHPWNFAKKRASIPASATAPVWGPARGFPIPVDFIRFIGSRDEPAFDIEADPSGSLWIVTDAAAPLSIIYIYDVTDTGRYPPSFVDAFASRLALDTCEDITNSNAKNQAHADRHRVYLLKAKSLNGLQRQATLLRPGTFLASRRGGWSNWRQPRS